jgi:hypothetical protein
MADLANFLKGVVGGMLTAIAGVGGAILLYFLVLPANSMLSLECKITRNDPYLFVSRDSCNRTVIPASAVPRALNFAHGNQE